MRPYRCRRGIPQTQDSFSPGDFFRINKINRLEFSADVYSILKRVQREYTSEASRETDDEEMKQTLILKLEEVVQLLATSLREEDARRNLESTNIETLLADFRIKYSTLRKRQDQMIDEQKQMNEILARLILTLNRDESLRGKIARKIGGFGESLASNTLAGLLVEAILQIISMK